MKYIYSATEWSLTPFYFSLTCIKYTNYSGIILYSGIMITLWCILIFTVPSYAEWTKYLEWSVNIAFPVFFTNRIVWFVFNLASTIFTILGVRKLLNTLELM